MLVKRIKRSKIEGAFTLLKTLHNKGLDRPARDDKERVFFLVIKIFDFAGLSIWYPIRGLSIKQKSIMCDIGHKNRRYFNAVVSN